jgi:hypothetical protein
LHYLIRANVSRRGKTSTAPIDPDAEHTQLLRRRDVPFEIVAHHPGVGGINSKLLQCEPVNALVRFAKSDLAFDENRIKKIDETEPFNLLTLGVAGAIGQQCQTAAGGAKPTDRFDCLRERLNTDLTPMRVCITNRGRQVRIVDAQLLQGEAHHFAPRRIELEPAGAMPLWIVPEPFRRLLNLLENLIDLMWDQTVSLIRTCLAPARSNVAAVVQNRVVEIEQNG